MAHPDEVVDPEREVPSKDIAAAQLRHERAKDGDDQDKKQAAVEEAHALSTRPDGSYAQLHEARVPTLAVADSDGLKADIEQAEAENEEQVNADVEAEKRAAKKSAAKKSAS